MKGLTEERPKCLLSVDGRPLLESAIDALRGGGIRELAIVTGYRADLLEGPAFRRTFHNAQWETTNMVYSLWQARPWMIEAPGIVCYSDILFGAKTILRLADAPGDIVVANNTRWREIWERRFADPLADAETFRRDAAGRLVEIGRRPSGMHEIEGQFMGLLAITPDGWSRIEATLSTLSSERFRDIDVTSLLQTMIEAGERIDTIDTDEAWWEFDSESDVEHWR